MTTPVVEVHARGAGGGETAGPKAGQPTLDDCGRMEGEEMAGTSAVHEF